MEGWIELQREEAWHNVGLCVQWKYLNRFLICEGLYLSNQYIVTPLINLTYIEQASKKPFISQQLIMKNISSKAIHIIIINISDLDMDREHHHQSLAYLQIVQTKVIDSKTIQYCHMHIVGIQQRKGEKEDTKRISVQFEGLSRNSIQDENRRISIRSLPSSFAFESQKILSFDIQKIQMKKQQRFKMSSSSFQDLNMQQNQINSLNNADKKQEFSEIAQQQHIQKLSQEKMSNNCLKDIDKNIELLKQQKSKQKRSLKYQLKSLLKSQSENKYNIHYDVQLSIKMMTSALALCQQLYGLSSKKEAHICYKIGKGFDDLKAYDLALQNYEKALKIYREDVSQRKNVAKILNNMGVVYHHGKFNFGKALQYYFEAFSIQKQLFGKRSIEVSKPLNNIAGVLYNQGEYEEAEKRYGQVLEIQRQFYTENHASYAETTFNLALCRFEIGKYFSAAKDYHKAVVIIKGLGLDKDHKTFLRIQNLKDRVRYRISNNDFKDKCICKETKAAYEIIESIR